MSPVARTAVSAAGGRTAFVGAYLITNLLNYAFLVAMSQVLGAREFSLFAALFGAVYFASAMQNTAQTAVAAAVASHPDLASSIVRHTAGVLALSVIPGAPLLLLAGSPIGAFLHTSNVMTVFAAGAAIWISIIAAVGYGALQGSARFGLLGLSLVVAAAGRLVVGVGLVLAGFAVTGGMAGIAIGIAASAIIALAPFRRSSAAIGVRPQIGADLMAAFVVSCVIAGHTSVDLILVRHWFPEGDAATYAAVTVVAKAVVFSSMAVAVLQFPSMVAEHAAGRRVSTTLPLAATIAVASSVALAAYVAFFAVPGLIFRGYDVGAPFLATYLTATILFAGSVTLLYQLLATRRFRLLALAPAAILAQAAIIAAWHPNIESVAFVVLATSAVLTLVLTIASFWPRSSAGLTSISSAAIGSWLRERRAA